MSEFQSTGPSFDPTSSGTPAPTGPELSTYGDPQQQQQQKLQVRVMVDERSVGGLIGKGGAVINKLRSDSGCKVNIADGMPGARHATVTVVGHHEQVANCLHAIADRLYERKRGGASNAETGRGEYTTYEVKGSGEVTIENCHIVLLVPNNQIGAMIGKGGAKVNAIRQGTGANIKISERTLGDSTEKSVTVVGNSKVVAAALQQICAHLNDDADKVATTPYVPRPEYDDYGYGSRDGYSRRDGRKRKQWPDDDYYYPPRGYPDGSYREYGPRGPPPPPPPPGPPQPTQTLVVPVPNYIMGTVIGRNGASINEIRGRSGATIKIAPLESGATDRMVTITGTPQQNEAAIAMIHQKMAEHGSPPS